VGDQHAAERASQTGIVVDDQDRHTRKSDRNL
jgi:hypothetical protein